MAPKARPVPPAMLQHIAAMVPGAEVHLLNVQPTGDDWMVRRMIKAEELRRHSE